MFKFRTAFSAMVLAVPCLIGTVHADDADLSGARSESCISLVRIKSSEVLDRSRMVFTMNNGSMYLNTLPYPCPGLRRDTPYLHRTSLNEICDLDIITVLNEGGGGYMPGASCGLGKFVPTSKEEVAALKEQLKAATRP